MTTFRAVFGVVVMVMAFAATYGLFIKSPPSARFFGEAVNGKLFRQTRRDVYTDIRRYPQRNRFPYHSYRPTSILDRFRRDVDDGRDLQAPVEVTETTTEEGHNDGRDLQVPVEIEEGETGVRRDLQAFLEVAEGTTEEGESGGRRDVHAPFEVAEDTTEEDQDDGRHLQSRCAQQNVKWPIEQGATLDRGESNYYDNHNHSWCERVDECLRIYGVDVSANQLLPRYRFDVMTVFLPLTCVRVGLPERSCDIDSCPDRRRSNVYNIGVRRLACNHRDGFQNGADCWGYSFSSGMQGCVHEYPDDDQEIEARLTCFAQVIQDLPNCTEEDNAHVAAITRGIVNLAITRDAGL